MSEYLEQWTNSGLATVLFVASLLTAANLVSAVLVFIDKARALSGGRRVPEAAFVGWALLGGFLGGIAAMRTARHKTQKRSFQLKYALAAAAHAGAWVAAFLLREAF